MIDMEYPMVVFTAHDRCDRCGSQAYTQATLEVEKGKNLELLFCLHHAKRYNDKLQIEGFTITHDIGAINKLVDNNYASV